MIYMPYSEKRQKLYGKLSNLHYKSLWDYLKDNPKTSYAEISKLLLPLEEDTSAFCVRSELGDEAIRTKNMRYITQDALVRYLHEFNANWKRTTKAINNRIHVYNYLRMFLVTHDKKLETSYEEAILKIWNYLEERVPPNYFWMPDSADDPIIVEAFDKFWNVEDFIAHDN